jgi:hypothetical protein
MEKFENNLLKSSKPSYKILSNKGELHIIDNHLYIQFNSLIKEGEVIDLQIYVYLDAEYLYDIIAVIKANLTFA